MKIFGVPIDDLSRREMLERVESFLSDQKFHRIATINPEFLLRAEKDPAFHYALTAADLRVADGIGIVLAGLFLSSSSPWKGEGREGLPKKRRFIERFAGADLMEEILRIANEKQLSVFLAVRKDGLSSYEEVRKAALEKYPGVRIFGKDILTGEIGNWKLEIGNCAIILCNFGIPSQEIFLASLKGQTNTLRLAMGVGGAFDFLTGKIRRAPGWLRTIGLEWLWRLILQPKRWKRIWNAVIIFPTRIFFNEKAAR